MTTTTSDRLPLQKESVRNKGLGKAAVEDLSEHRGQYSTWKMSNGLDTRVREARRQVLTLPARGPVSSVLAARISQHLYVTFLDGAIVIGIRSSYRTESSDQVPCWVKDYYKASRHASKAPILRHRVG